VPVEFASFAFIITLAAVINGLGIVRWVSGLADYLRRHGSLTVTHYWIYNLAAGFQMLLHVLLWWSLWGVRGGTLNFLTYLYLLAGPVVLFLGTALMAPNLDTDHIDLRRHFVSVRRTYSITLALLWIWAIFTTPVFHGFISPSAPLFSGFFAVASLQFFARSERIQAVAAILNWLLLGLFVAMYAMQLGGVITNVD
jgi:hypothetical protein